MTEEIFVNNKIDNSKEINNKKYCSSLFFNNSKNISAEYYGNSTDFCKENNTLITRCGCLELSKEKIDNPDSSNPKSSCHRKGCALLDNKYLTNDNTLVIKIEDKKTNYVCCVPTNEKCLIF